jgi:hypothetical protein
VSSEVVRGLDIFEVTPSKFISQNEIDAAKTVHFEYLNTQGQPKLVWPPTFALARAYVDQLARSNGLSDTRIGAIRDSLLEAEGVSGATRKQRLSTLAAQLDADAKTSRDAMKVRMLARGVRQLSEVR